MAGYGVTVTVKLSPASVLPGAAHTSLTSAGLVHSWAPSPAALVIGWSPIPVTAERHRG